LKKDQKYILTTLIFKVLIAFASMGIVIITSQKLGAEGRGIISYILLLISLAQLISEFIGGSTLVNLAPKEKLINLMVPSYIAQMIVSVLLSFIFIGITHLMVSAWTIFFTCLLLGTVNVNLSLILGRSFINTRNTIQLIYMLLSLGGVFMMYQVNESRLIQDYFNVLMFSYAIGFIISSIVLINKSTSTDFDQFKWNPLLIRWGFWSQLSQIVNLLNYRIMYFFIEKDYGLSKLGVFGNAMTVGDMLKISGHSLGQVQHNRIIRSVYKLKVSRKILPKYLLLNFVLYMFQGAILIAIPAGFWVYLLGADFAELKIQIILLLPGFIAMGIATSYSFHFHALSAFKINLLVNAATLLIFIIAYYTLVSAYGFQAIHISFSVAFVMQVILFVIIYLLDNKNRSSVA
jgi:O-antigen/teichoic acid export membrane protein